MPEHTGTPVSSLTPAQFTQLFAASLRQSAPDMNAQIVEDLEIRFESSKELTGEIHLQSAYQKYMQDPGLRDDIISHWVAFSLEASNLSPDAPIDRSRILPVLKHKSWLGLKNENATSAGGDPEEDAHQRFTEDLIVAYVVDAPETIRYLTNKNLADLKVSVEELHKQALKNLVSILPAVDIQEANGVYRVRCDGNYDASLVLLDDFWDKWPFKVPGEIVVAVPARDWLLVTGSEFPAGIYRVSMIAQEVVATSLYSVTSRLLIRQKGKFVRYQAKRSSI